MYAPSFGSSPPHEGGGPSLVARRYYDDFGTGSRTHEQLNSSDAVSAAATAAATGAHTGEDEDDSLGVVFSADTGAGRAHTPQRLNRTHTPQRIRSSSFLHTMAAPVLQALATRGEGDARRQPVGRRKQRRWDNDNLLGVEKFLRGRHAHTEGEAEHLTISHPWRSSLADLVADHNTSPAAAEARESIRKGAQPASAGQATAGGAANPGARRFAGGKWEDAEERFLLVERRLRDIVVRALRSTTLLSFVVGLEALVEGFAQSTEVPPEMPPVLQSALASRPTVELEKGKGKVATLLVPLGPSPFHRLLLHALCQYRKLRSRSEETSHGRVVRVAFPTSDTGADGLAVPDVRLTEFVLATRLAATVSDVAGGGDAGSGGGRVSQSSPRAIDAKAASRRCAHDEPAAGNAGNGAVAAVA